MPAHKFTQFASQRTVLIDWQCQVWITKGYAKHDHHLVGDIQLRPDRIRITRWKGLRTCAQTLSLSPKEKTVHEGAVPARGCYGPNPVGSVPGRFVGASPL
jgi:hypothetical protein